MFWPMFYAAWKKAFTSDNKSSAFAATGIFPYDSKRVLPVIRRPSTPPPFTTAQQLPKTPLTFRAVHWAHHAYKNNPSEERLEQIM